MELNERVAKLEVKEKELRHDIVEIKEQVTNHIPSQIREVKEAVDTLTTQHVAQSAVKQAWDNNFKKAALILGVVWTLIKLIELAK